MGRTSNRSGWLHTLRSCIAEHESKEEEDDVGKIEVEEQEVRKESVTVQGE